MKTAEKEHRFLTLSVHAKKTQLFFLPSFLLFSLSFHSSIEQLDYEMEMRDGGSNEPHRVKFPKITNTCAHTCVLRVDRKLRGGGNGASLRRFRPNAAASHSTPHSSPLPTLSYTTFSPINLTPQIRLVSRLSAAIVASRGILRRENMRENIYIDWSGEENCGVGSF